MWICVCVCVCVCVHTFHREDNGLAGLVLSVLVVHSLGVVASSIRGHRGQDNQSVVQGDSSTHTHTRAHIHTDHFPFTITYNRIPIFPTGISFSDREVHTVSNVEHTRANVLCAAAKVTGPPDMSFECPP